MPTKREPPLSRWRTVLIRKKGKVCVVVGEPRSMKMGTTGSLWRYDAAARRASQPANLRRPSTFHYASRGAAFATSKSGEAVSASCFPTGRGLSSKIQSICNTTCDGNYNAKRCAGARKAAGARTMASNGKSNAQSNGNSRKPGRVPTSVVMAGRQRRCALSRCPDGPDLLAGWRVSLGAQRPD